LHRDAFWRRYPARLIDRNESKLDIDTSILEEQPTAKKKRDPSNKRLEADETLSKKVYFSRNKSNSQGRAHTDEDLEGEDEPQGKIRASQSFNHGYEKMSSRTDLNQRRMNRKKYNDLSGNLFYNNEMADDQLKKYIEKLQYKNTLDQQVLEKNLRKRHEEEKRILEEKIEELKYAQEKMKEKLSASPPAKHMSSFIDTSISFSNVFDC